MSRAVLILSPDVISERMAGPAIRYWEFAKALATEHQVTLAAPNDPPDSLTPQGFGLLRHHPDNIDQLIADHDIILFQGHVLDMYPQVAGCDKVLVADIYDPIPLEGLEQNKHRDRAEASREIENQVRVMNSQLKWADYFLCASDRQRDLWLGSLMALGRLNPTSYPDIEQRILVVPFGLPDDPPMRNGVGLREKYGEDSFLLLWGGGIWEWFDPLTVIRAVRALREEWPALKLVFLGTRHPNPTVPIMPMQDRAMALAEELGLTDTHVFFQSGWVPYDQLANYLLDANAFVSAHHASLETHYSFRTRTLYYLWAGKPILATQGDILADAVARHGAGRALPQQDVNAWVDALRELRDESRYRHYQAGIAKLARQYPWRQVTRPLLEMCHHARRAEDVRREEGLRILVGYDCEWERERLSRKLAEMEQSNSWKITAPIRHSRRWWDRMRGE